MNASYIADGMYGNMVQLLWKTSLACFKTTVHATQTSAISLPGIYPGEVKTYVNIETYIEMFKAALFDPQIETTRISFSGRMALKKTVE